MRSLHWLLITVYASLPASVRAAPGGTPRPVAAGPELVLWHNQDGAQATLLGSLVADWSKQSGVSVRLETGMRLAESLLTTKQRPDAALGPSDLATHCGELGCSTLKTADLGSRFDPAILATVTTKGQLVGVPVFYGNHLMLFYNRRLAPTPPKDWHELAPDPKSKSGTKIALDLQSAYVFAAFVNGFSDSEARRSELRPKRDALLKAMTAYRQLLDADIVPKACDHRCVGADFLSGKYPYAINGDWAVTEARRVLGADLGLAPLPTWDGTRLISLKASHALIFPSDSWNGPKKIALRSLANWLLSPASQRRFATDGWHLPATRLQGASWPPAESELRQALAKTAAQAAPLVPRPDIALTWAALQQGLRLVVGANQTAAAAVDGIYAFGGIPAEDK